MSADTQQTRGAYFGEFVSPIEEILEDARNGRMFVLVDAEDRENEGDLVIPAQMATPDAVNFMARFGRGLICLALTQNRVNELNLPLMAAKNESRNHTAFTVSIEAREGISTGISAADRARTISVAIDPTKHARDIVSPGHVFPLMAQEGGVLVRTGHTEAAVDISRLAGLYPAGVICEIMNDDGTMARADDLVKFAQFHGLKIATIADLIAYRIKHDNLVSRKLAREFPTAFGEGFRIIVYDNVIQGSEHIALVKGTFTEDEPVMVRMHAVNLLDDFLAFNGKTSNTIAQSMRMINEAGKGAVVIIRDFNPTAVSARFAAEDGEGAPDTELREYGVGAQIVRDLGIRNMVLLSNSPSRTIVGLEGYGLTVVGQRAIPVAGHIAEN